MSNFCQSCVAPAEYSLCHVCTGHLRKTIVAVRRIVEELEVQITKQAVGAQSVGGKSDEAPLIFDEKASAALDEIARCLELWVLPNPRIPWLSLTKAQKTILLCDFLLHEIIEASRQDAAGSNKHALELALKNALGVIDRKFEKIPVAICPCERTVRADFDDTIAECVCGQVFDVQATRDKTRAFGRNQIVTARTAIALGEFEGVRLNENTIRGWVNQGTLETQGQDEEGRSLYRFGDLLNVLALRRSQANRGQLGQVSG